MSVFLSLNCNYNLHNISVKIRLKLIKKLNLIIYTCISLTRSVERNYTHVYMLILIARLKLLNATVI